MNWKIKRDPYYSALYKRFGEDKIVEAGFIYDSDTVDRDVKASTNILCTPLHKVSANLAKWPQHPNFIGKGPCVLLSCGSFAPIHEGHTLILGQARAEVEKNGYTCIGGYISPSHDEYIKAKTGADWIPIHYRNRAIQDLIKTSDWLSLDPWEGTFNKVAINFTDVVMRLEAYLKKHLGADIPVFFVCGGDNAKFALTFIEIGRCIVVNRPGYEDRYEKYKSIIQSGLIDSPKVNERIFWSPGGNALSSTGVRKDKKFQADEKKSLILRVEEYSDLEPSIISKMKEEFASVNQKKLSEQKKQFEEISPLSNFISLDSLKNTGHTLEVSRLYDLFGINLIDYINRPGTPPLSEQVDKIAPDKDYYLFDDDIHSGGTMRYAKSILKHKLNIKGVFSFSISSADEGEILDCRDFILNDNKNSGLVVELPNGKHIRAPYLYPYVDIFQRGSIDSPMQFSLEMWKINAGYFKKYQFEHMVEPRLKDYPNWLELFTYIGFKPEDKMFQICQWHIDLLTNFV